MNFQQELNDIFEIIKDTLPAGVEFTTYNIPSYSGNGSSGKSYFTIVDGKANREAIPEALKDSSEYRNIEINRRISDIEFDITVAQEPGRFVIFSVSKENGYTYRIATPEELVQLTKLDLMRIVDPGMRKEVFAEVAPDKKTGKPDVVGRQILYYANGEVKEYTGVPASDFARAAFHALDGKLKFVYVMISETDVIIKTSPAIPGVTELYEINEDLTLDVSKIENIYEFLESFSEAKIEKALEALEANPEFKAKAEKRYGEFIKVRVGKEAGIESFEKAALTRKEVELFSDQHFVKKIISLSRLYEEECQTIVDFIGSMIMSHLDIHEFKKRMEATESEEELKAFYDVAAEKVKKGILAEVKVYNKGWFGEISEMLANHKVEQLMFEKTDFSIENNDALKGFMFYLDLNKGRELYFDIYQSYFNNPTEFFWFLPNVPQTAWGDTTVKWPEYTLKFSRKAAYKINDSGRWKTHIQEPAGKE